MNDIIFRGFHPDENGEETAIVNHVPIKGRWCYGNLLEDENSGIKAIVPYVNLAGDIHDLSEITISSVIPETIGQYIGLTDKDGRQIFEGDIITFDHPYGGCSIHAVVRDEYRFNLRDFHATYFDNPSDAFSEGTEYMKVMESNIIMEERR